MNDNNIIITKETTKRLLSDVTDLIKNPLIDENIYYILFLCIICLKRC